MKRGLKGNVVALVLGLTLFLACGTVYASETEQTPTVQTETEQLDTYTETVTNAVNTADTAAVRIRKLLMTIRLIHLRHLRWNLLLIRKSLRFRKQR